MEKVSYWQWSKDSGELVADGSFTELLGLYSEKGASEKIKKHFPDNEYGKLIDAIASHAASGKRELFRFQSRHQTEESGAEIILEWRGRTLFPADDALPARMAGSVSVVVGTAEKTKTTISELFLFNQLMDEFNESIYFKDREGRFLKMNRACAAKFGLDSPAEAVGKTDFDFFKKEHAQAAYSDEQKVIESESPMFNKVEKEVFSDQEGRIQWASTSKMPLYNGDGTVAGTFGITRDITAQREAEINLQRSNKMIAKLSEQVPGFFYLYHFLSEDTGCFPFASLGIRDVYELEPEDVSENIDAVMDRVHEDDLERVRASIQESAKSLVNWETDFRVVLPSKGVRWLRGKAKPERQPDGTVIGYGYISDITEKKEAYMYNIRLKRQFQAVLDSVPNLIFVKDMDGKFVMVNDSACRFFGKSEEEIIGKTDLEIGISEEKAAQYREREEKVIRTGKTHFTSEDKTVKSDGTVVWHQTIKVPFQQIDSNRPSSVLTIVTDVTERKKNELELSKSLNVIKDQNERLTNFALIVSHNLRNHASNISMILSLLDSEESEKDRRELLGHLGTASKRLNEAIADLNVMIDEQYRKEQDFVKTNLAKIVEKSKEILSADITSHNVRFDEDIPEDLVLDGNSAYLDSIVLNLLSNAIKYHHPDRSPVIQIRGFREQGRIGFEVTDNGLGIDLEKNRKKLFGMYNTFHGNENSKGIGLYITKNQVESMGGQIEVESEPGVGTMFRVTFPVEE